MEKSRISRFEDLDAWKKAEDLVLEIHRALKTLPSQEREVLAEDLFMAACLVAVRIAQGFELFYYEDKVKHYQKGRSLAVKVQVLVEIAKGLNLIDENTCRDLLGRTDMVKKMINGMLISLEKNSHKFTHKA